MPSVNETAALFDDWARSGRAEGMEKGHRPRAIQALEDMPIDLGDKLLDLGCGNGWATLWLREKTGSFGAAVGVDASPEMVARAREAHGTHYGLSFRKASFDKLVWSDGFFNHAFSMEALYYALDLGAALTEVRRVLKPGGTLTVCTDFYEENPECQDWQGMMGIPMTMLSEAGWSGALEDAGFVIERSWRCRDRRADAAESAGSLAVRGRKRL